MHRRVTVTGALRGRFYHSGNLGNIPRVTKYFSTSGLVVTENGFPYFTNKYFRRVIRDTSLKCHTSPPPCRHSLPHRRWPNTIPSLSRPVEAVDWKRHSDPPCCDCALHTEPWDGTQLSCHVMDCSLTTGQPGTLCWWYRCCAHSYKSVNRRKWFLNSIF